jgi:predicted TPR repeat methyltransferase
LQKSPARRISLPPAILRRGLSAVRTKVNEKRAMAGRRLQVAQALMSEGDGEGAAELAREALELDPDWAEAWFLLGEALQSCGKTEAASAAFRSYLERQPQDALGAGPRLALLGAGPTPGRLPPAYVKRLFDQIAPAFEAQLLGRLGYRAPALLWRLLQPHRGRLPEAPGILDLGCGTGLAGEVFRGLGGRLHGLDLSPAMLAQARAKRLYESLRSGDLLAPPPEDAERYDLLVAADVFNYLGDLSPAFHASALRLRPGGLLLFSVEAASLDPAAPPQAFALGPGQRYRHDIAALRAWLAGAGFHLLAQECGVLRRERREAVEGWLLLAELPRPEDSGLLALAGDLAKVRAPGAR